MVVIIHLVYKEVVIQYAALMGKKRDDYENACGSRSVNKVVKSYIAGAVM